MRFFAIVALIAVIPALPVSAQNKPQKKPESPKAEAASKSEAAPGKQECPEYGAGFFRINGTGTCVKVGGYVRMQGVAR